MRKLWLVLVLAVVVASCKDAEQRIALVTYDPPNGMCSAVPITEQLLITADHCVFDDYVVYADEQVAQVASVSPPLAILRVAEPYYIPVELGEWPKVGDRALHVGYGGNSELPFLFEGIYMGDMDHLVPFKMAFFSTRTVPGMSGGPILDKKGKLISVVLGSFGPASNYDNIGTGALYVDVSYLYNKWVLR
jgi:hypothetical protein